MTPSSPPRTWPLRQRTWFQLISRLKTTSTGSATEASILYRLWVAIPGSDTSTSSRRTPIGRAVCSTERGQGNGAGAASPDRWDLDSVPGMLGPFFLNSCQAFLDFRAQAFGVGAMEEEDGDIYHRDAMSNYDIVLGDEEQGDALFGWTAPQQYTTKKNGECVLHVCS